jgi:hypothetical protein
MPVSEQAIAEIDAIFEALPKLAQDKLTEKSSAELAEIISIVTSRRRSKLNKDKVAPGVDGKVKDWVVLKQAAADADPATYFELLKGWWDAFLAEDEQTMFVMGISALLALRIQSGLVLPPPPEPQTEGKRERSK